MNKKKIIFTIMLFAIFSFGVISCENPNDNSGISLENKPDNNVSEETPTRPQIPVLVATEGTSDVGRFEVTFWGRLNTDTLWTLGSVKWGVEYAYNKDAVVLHKHLETTKVECKTDLQGEELDEFSVTVKDLSSDTVIYYSAYILINDMKYVYGDIDSVHTDVIISFFCDDNNYYYAVNNVEITSSDPNAIIDYGFSSLGYYISCDYGTKVKCNVVVDSLTYYEFEKWSEGLTNNLRTIVAKSDRSYTFKLTHPICNNYVDLGLPSGTLWATCNLGAFSPEEYGGYYEDFSGEEIPMVSKSWRLPSLSELYELVDQCTRTSTYKNGVYGINLKGPNGNSIFLPAAGVQYKSGDWNMEYLVYFSSSNSKYPDEGYSPRILFYYRNDLNVGGWLPLLRAPIRPVRNR